MAAFFGNATQETQWFAKLHEGSSSAKYAPWDGRGFLQLTWPANYITYWRWRGRTVDKELEKALDVAQHRANRTGKNDELQNNEHPGLTDEMIQLADHRTRR